jgi:hypothetical protein
VTVVDAPPDAIGTTTMGNQLVRQYSAVIPVRDATWSPINGRIARMSVLSRVSGRIAGRLFGPIRPRIVQFLKRGDALRRMNEITRRPPLQMNTAVLLLADGTPCIVYDDELPHVVGIEIGIDKRIALDCVDFRTRHVSRVALDHPLSSDMLSSFEKFEHIGIGRLTGEKTMEDLHMVRASFEDEYWEGAHPVPISAVTRRTLWISVWAVLFLVALVHVVRTRPLTDWRYLLGVAALVETYILFQMANAYRELAAAKRKFGARLDPAGLFGGTIGVSIFSVPIAGVLYVMFAAAKDVMLAALAFAPLKGTIVIFAIAAALFWFRLRFRATYGTSEIYAGLYIYVQQLESRGGGLTLHGRHPDIGLLAVLASGVYLVIRGMDNFHQGMSKDPLFKWLRGR